ncbi:MAG: helix-hairpin-helix domain-containing protein [Prevotellaceae bacterium]|jgi:DNA uptake protein ComE-like DNA-binding protein|nr:helix-hairpin-helix domain-containing protein [Prevotellaceae bacterium]
MLWSDFFYFSKGERRGLVVILCLIVVAAILLLLNDRSEPEAGSGFAQTSLSNKASDKQPGSTDSLLSGRSFPEQSAAPVSSPAKKPVLSKKNASSSENVMATRRSASEKKESVSERVQRLTSETRPSYPRTEKFKKDTVIELNTADTILLKKVPGIGNAFARRIVNYRNILGGYYSAIQLSEVYGIDEEKYNTLAPWFSADPSLISLLHVNRLSQDSLRRHPYINFSQAKVIVQLRRQKGKLTGWENLFLLDEFTDDDRLRLQHYLSFE